MIALQAVFALLLLAVAVHAQRMIPHFTAGARAILLARAVLLAVGVLFGVVMARSTTGLEWLLTVAIGFGAVHVPAAVVLAIKRARGERRS